MAAAQSTETVSGPTHVTVEVAPTVQQALKELGQVKDRRDTLVDTKEELRRRRRELEAQRPATWGVAADTKSYESPLGRAEYREEAAIVESYARLERDATPAGELVHERVRVRTEPKPDPRIWSHIIRGERALVRRLIAPQERWVRRMLEPQQAFVARSRRRIKSARSEGLRGWTLVVVAAVPLFLLSFLVRIEEALFLNVVKGQQALAHTAVDLPLTVQSGYLVSREELRSEQGRRLLRLSLLNERFLTPERRKVLLFLAATIFLIGYLLSELALQLLAPDFLAAKRQSDLVFFYAVSTRLFVPLPFEPILLRASAVVGVPWAVLVAALGATLGSWLLFLAGSGANKGLKKLGRRFPWLVGTLTWFETKGRVVAYVVLGVLLSIPFSPDSLTVVGAMLGLRLGPFLGVIFASAVVRSYIFLALLA